MIYFVLYTTCQPIKDNLIGSLLYFNKNEEEEECCFWDLTPTFTNTLTNLLNAHFFFYIFSFRSLNPNI